MPRLPLYTLIWSQDRSRYELSTHDQLPQHFRPEDEHLWLTWLEAASSFAFQGGSGRLNVYKEQRGRARQYWYAYHTNARRTLKRYLGRSANLTFARLEEVAQTLNSVAVPLAPALPPREAEAALHTTQPEVEQRMVLLATKLSQPRLPSTLVARERLLSSLDAARAHRLTVLSAAGGWGKTTLLSSWASLYPDLVAWLSLDELDNDSLRFWTSLIVALQHSSTCPPSIGEVALALLRARQPQPLSTILTTLLNEVHALEGEVILILDDYHVIEEQAIHDSLLFFLEHLPANLHLVLSSRVDPPLKLSRWRVRGEMLEVREEDLRMTSEEVASFLRQAMALSLTEAEVALLESRTEGWIAGLQLAALAMQKREDTSAFVRGFTGSHRYLLDYVQEDILARLPETLQNFLLHIAILRRISASLCQAITEEAGSSDLLERIERANLFLIPLDEQRDWYRLHDLFREALLARLHATQPAMIPLLHQRAARWYEARGLLSEAIAHALEANDMAYAADLLERFIVPQSWRNEYHTLRRWLERLPSEVLSARPDLSFLYVQTIIFTSARGPQLLEQVATPLSWAEQGYREASRQAELGEVETLRAVLTSFQGDFLRSFALAQQALTRLPEHDSQWRGHCLSLLGTEAVFSGQSWQASQLLRQGLALYETSGSLPGTLFATAMLGEVYLNQGELHQAARLFSQALAVSNERQALSQSQLTLVTGVREIYYERIALYGLALLAYEWNNLEEAERLLQEALFQGQNVWSSLLTPGLLLQVRLFFAHGEVQQAQDLLSDLVAREQRPAARREILCCQAWLALKMGDLTRAAQWASSSNNDPEPIPLSRREEEVLLLARLRMAEGQPEVALDLLARWRGEAGVETRKYSALQILLLETVAYEACGARTQAREKLLQACVQARSEGYQRSFLDEGERIETVLKTLARDTHDEALATYIRRLLRAFAFSRTKSPPSSPNAPSVLVSPLTPQEQRVLRLLADGVSNQEIANQLMISLTTAKKHVANILGKLGAQNRTQAVALAREYALL